MSDSVDFNSPKNPALRAALLGALGSAVALKALEPRQAQAAMAVFDASNLAKNAETAANTMQQLSKLTDLLGVANKIRSIIGLGTSNLGGLISTSGGSGSVLGSTRKLAQPDVNRALGRSGQSGLSGAGSVTDAPSAISLVRQAIGSQAREGATSKDQVDLSYSWMNAEVASAEDAMGTALYGRQAAADGPTSVSKLSQEAEAAAKPDDDSGGGGNMRQQIAVLTAANLAVIERLDTLISIQSAHAQRAAATTLATRNKPLFTSISPQGGEPAGKPAGQSLSNTIFK